MAKTKSTEAQVLPFPSAQLPYPDLTGVAITLKAAPTTPSGVQTFHICMIFLVEGSVVHVEETQSYASFEADPKASVIASKAMWNLNSRFKSGLYQGLGGDEIKALVDKYQHSNPELLKKIAPAIALDLGKVFV